MNVVHIIPSLELEASGPTYSVTRLCESLIAQGLPIILLALGEGPLLNPKLSWLRTFPRSILLYKLGVSLRMLQWLLMSSQKKSISLLHNHGLWMMPNIYPGYISRKFNIPLIISPRGTLSDYAIKSGTRLKILIWFLFQKKVLSQASCFHATSYSEYLDIRRLGFKQPVAIIPNGIDIPRMPPLKEVSKFRTLLFLGRIHPIKGLDMLLPAWEKLQSDFPDWRLRVVGPDNKGYLKEMKSLASKLNLQRLEFVGPAYKQDKNREIASADLFVLPTYSENFGMAVAEFLAAGVPVVVSKGAPWEGVLASNAGWWPEIGVESLIEALYDAMGRSPEELRQMGMNGRNWMEAEYAWTSVGNKMAVTYQWILSGGKAPEWILSN